TRRAGSAASVTRGETRAGSSSSSSTAAGRGRRPSPSMRLGSDLLELEVLPECGMTIVALRLLADGRNPLWERPAHPPEPASRDVGPPGVASIDSLHAALGGGWFEMSPHCGLPGVLDGAETMLHGEASRLPWDVVAAAADAVEAVAECVRS